MYFLTVLGGIHIGDMIVQLLFLIFLIAIVVGFVLLIVILFKRSKRSNRIEEKLDTLLEDKEK